MGWKWIFRHRVLQKGVSLLRTKSRKSGPCGCSGPTTPDRPGIIDSFLELTVNFYRLKTKEISVGRLVFGDWLGHLGCLLEWASLPNWESGSLLVMIRVFWLWLQRDSVSFGDDLGSGLHFCDPGARHRTCSLGQYSTRRLHSHEDMGERTAQEREQGVQRSWSRDPLDIFEK